MRRLFKLLVLAALVNALYRVAPVWIHYYQFRDALQELALFNKDTTDAAVIDRIMALADEHQVPLMREYVQIVRDRSRLAIEAPYVEQVRIVPGYTYNWQFDTSVDVWHSDPLGPVKR